MRARNAADALVDLKVAASGKLEVEASTTAAVAAVAQTLLFNAQSVAASGSANSGTVDGTNVKRCRVLIDSAGADITVSLQASADGGTTWFSLASYAVGATGIQAVTELPGPLLRLRAANGNAVSAQSVTARIVTERGY